MTETSKKDIPAEYLAGTRLLEQKPHKELAHRFNLIIATRVALAVAQASTC